MQFIVGIKQFLTDAGTHFGRLRFKIILKIKNCIYYYDFTLVENIGKLCLPN